MTGSGKSSHDPLSMYEDESMASLKEKLVRAEEVNDTFCVYGKTLEWENLCGWNKNERFHRRSFDSNSSPLASCHEAFIVG